MTRFLRALLAATSFCLLGGNAFAQASPDAGWPASERLMSEYKAGRYASVIAEAPTVLQSEPWNNELRLAYAYSLLWTGREWPALEQFGRLLDTDVGVDARLGLANGLAWAGRMSESLPHYSRLAGTQHAGEAKLGAANALRWMGRDDLALPMYSELRAAYPDDKNLGEEGIFYATRAVRARTTFGYGYTHDNTEMNRREPFVSHSWRMANHSLVFGLEANGGDDWGDVNGGRKLSRREYGLRVEALAVPLAPRFAVSRQTDPQEHTFGELRLALADWPLYLHVGRVNWSKIAFTVPADMFLLSATRVGIEGKYQTRFGELRGFANRYRISGETPVPASFGLAPVLADQVTDNVVDNGELRLALRWRPFGKEVKPYIGTAWRRADHNVTSFYWSPNRYVLGFVGLEGEWVAREYSLTLIAQLGGRLAGEAATSWSAAVVGKRWLADDFALGINAYALSGTRESRYRAHGATVTVEKLW